MAKNWLVGCQDYHTLAQLINGTFHAILYMVQNNQTKFKLRQSTLDLFNFLLQNVIGPWFIFRISIRLGDVESMMQVYYTSFQNLAVCTNAYSAFEKMFKTE